MLRYYTHFCGTDVMARFVLLAGGLLVSYDQAAFNGKHFAAVGKVLQLIVLHFN